MNSENSYESKFDFGVPATYRDPLIPFYRGNPLIEALPQYRSHEDVIKELVHLPSIDVDIKSLPEEVAIQFLRNLDQFFQPNKLHIDLERKISVAIHNGYITRNPAHIQYWRSIREFLHPKNELIPAPRESLRLDAKTNSFALLAPTGTGKTISVKKIFQQLYDQVITHTTFNDRIFYFTQIVWLHLQCPSDGSLKGLCHNILHAIDAAIGGDHFKRYAKNGRASANQLKADIKILSLRYGIGIMAFDEFANLIDAKVNDRRDVINFMIEMDNILALPILAVGTLDALPLLEMDLQIARREDGQGSAVWSRMQQPDPKTKLGGDIWTPFVRELFKCQVLPVKVQIENDTELENVLYKCSLGIPDLVVKLFIFAQIRALLTKKDCLTTDLVASVALDSLQLAQPILRGYPKGNLKSVRQLDPPGIPNLEEFIKKELGASTAINITGNLDSQIATSTPDNNKDLVSEAENTKKGKTKKTKDKKFSEGDLRLLLQAAKKNKVAPHTALAQAGLIFSIYDAIPAQVKK